MSWKVTDSRAAADERDAWVVSVVDDQGSGTGEVRVRIAELAGRAEPPEIASVRKSEGRSAVEAALTADPTALPVEILVGLEGNQPVLPEHAPGSEGGETDDPQVGDRVAPGRTGAAWSGDSSPTRE
jgi:hypothetical protein